MTPPSNLPTGTVTAQSTDVEGSARLLPAALPTEQAVASALEREG